MRHWTLSVRDLRGVGKSAPDEVLKTRGLVGGICKVFALVEFYFRSRFRVRSAQSNKLLGPVRDAIDRGRPLQVCVNEGMIDAFRNGALTLHALMRDSSSFRSAVITSTPRSASAFALSLLTLRVMARTW